MSLSEWFSGCVVGTKYGARGGRNRGVILSVSDGGWGRGRRKKQKMEKPGYPVMGEDGRGRGEKI